MKRFVLTRLTEDDLHQIKSHLAARAGPTRTSELVIDGLRDGGLIGVHLRAIHLVRR